MAGELEEFIVVHPAGRALSARLQRELSKDSRRQTAQIVRARNYNVGRFPVGSLLRGATTIALAGLVMLSAAVPGRAAPQLPVIASGGTAINTASTAGFTEIYAAGTDATNSVDVPGYGRLPNPDVAALITSDALINSPKSTPHRELTPEQQHAAATSILNSLPLAPARAAAAGTVVESESVPLMVNDRLWNAEARRIKYNSTDSLGNKSLDTAILVTPTAKWQGSGPRPIVAIAPGTQGSGEECDPSVSTQSGLTIQVGPVDIVAPYEVIPMLTHLQRGASVVMIDHHRNSQGNQDYADNIASAQSLLDAVSATLELGVDPKASVGIYGYSQGGSAAAAAAERAAIYAPELNIKATSAGGPPSDLVDVLDHIDGTALTAAIGLSINSVLGKDPTLARAIESELNDEGKRLLKEVGEYCSAGLGLHHAFENTRQYTTSGEPLGAIIERFAPALTELGRQRVGNFVPNAPVFLYSGEHDDIIPIDQVRKLRDSWINLGFTDLTYYEDPTGTLLARSGANHLASLLSNLQQATDFIWQHFPAAPGKQPANLK